MRGDRTMTNIDKAGRMLARVIDRIDNLMDRLWLWKLKVMLYVAQKLYDKIIAEMEGAEI